MAPASLQLIYVHDPMCSWCWAYAPVWRELQNYCQGQAIHTTSILGGLAPDTREPMPAAMRATIEGYWRHIAQVVPGTRFNHDFWQQCEPRRATYPACRAVIAARKQGAEARMNAALQEAYYLRALNPSDEQTALQLARELNLDVRAFEQALRAPETQRVLETEVLQARQMGVQGFPSLVLQYENHAVSVPVVYADAGGQIQQLSQVIRQIPR